MLTAQRKQYHRNYQRLWRKRNREKWNATMRRWREKHPDAMHEIYRRKALRENYGLTVQQYEEMLKSQNGLCACCGQPPPTGRRLCVDHDHKTGKIRGLLCDGCNVTTGYLESPRVELCQAYLARFRQ